MLGGGQVRGIWGDVVMVVLLTMGLLLVGWGILIMLRLL
jgi:hypothetical protein